ncbi:hypothetical protein C9374_008708 [Naegleria lovaniensis]|uniref:Uncharacterized protein n=1 Tax=Naegleria lovaniensis TaxID=51637 RepID=A0AA88KHD8_NAELO|nr:uncharacterized protein C9374_008708 [Naegleria lovaniensis]KAG2378086.1 hypothetical protein C9374_008708 [Naegleria lovaniensis]
MSNAMIVALVGSPSKRRNSILASAFDESSARELVSRAFTKTQESPRVHQQQHQPTNATSSNTVIHHWNHHITPPQYALPEETLLNLLSMEVSPSELQERFKQYFVENERVIQHYKKSLEEYREKLKHANEETEFYSNQVHQLTRELNALTQEVQDERDKVKQLTSDLKAVQRECKLLNKKNQALQQKIAKRNSCINHISSHLKQVQEDFRKSKQQNELRIEELKHEIQILQQRHSQHQESILEQTPVYEQPSSIRSSVTSDSTSPDDRLFQALHQLQVERSNLRLEFEKHVTLMKESIIKGLDSKRMQLRLENIHQKTSSHEGPKTSNHACSSPSSTSQ